jgi:MFS family permease
MYVAMIYTTTMNPRNSPDSTSVPAVFIGRALQAIGSTTTFIVGYATLRDMIDAENIGKTLGLLNSFQSAGALSGPAMAGVLLELTGYWITWGTVFLVILSNLIMRLAMIEKPQRRPRCVDVGPRERGVSTSQTPGPPTVPEVVDSNSTLLSGTSPQSYGSTGGKDRNLNRKSITTASFYKVIMSQPRVIIGLGSYMAHGSLISSYSTTIPTHVKRAFGWGSLSTGLLFATLQVPNLVLSPIYGWIRDRVGTRLPVTLGFQLLALLLWLLGAADQGQYPWAVSEDNAKTTYAIAVIGIGCFQPLLSGVGTIEITRE